MNRPVSQSPIPNPFGDVAPLVRPLPASVIDTALAARIMSDPSLYKIVTLDQLASRVAQALVS